MKGVFGVGVGELLQSGFLIVTSLVLNNLAVAYGDGPLAAMGVAVRIAQVPEFLVMGVTIGILPLLAYSFGKGDGDRLRSALRGGALTVGAIMLLFAGTVFVFRDQVFTALRLEPGGARRSASRSSPRSSCRAIFNGFTGLLTSLFQATGRAVPSIIISMAQGVLFIPIVLLVQRLVRPGRHHLVAHRQRGPRARRRADHVGRLPRRHRPRPRGGLARSAPRRCSRQEA